MASNRLADAKAAEDFTINYPSCINTENGRNRKRRARDEEKREEGKITKILCCNLSKKKNVNPAERSIIRHQNIAWSRNAFSAGIQLKIH